MMPRIFSVAPVWLCCASVIRKETSFCESRSMQTPP